MATTTDLSTLMSRAWAMHRETRQSLDKCMSRAWGLYRLQIALRGKSLIHIEYRKKDGSLRKAIATNRMGNTIIEGGNGTRRPSPKVFTYWDVEAADFRCFKCENIINWY